MPLSCAHGVQPRIREWIEAVEVVATDLAESYRRGIAEHLEHTVLVADPFHVVRAANRVVDKVRRRVQNETLGHRGRKADPLYRIRRLLISGSERLDERGHKRILLGLRRGDPTTSSSAPGLPDKSRCVTST